jgi:8-amino-7-oxononanoate synthase
LIQSAKAYIYTTASPPALAAALVAAINVIKKDDARHQHLRDLIAYFKENLSLKKWQLMPSDTAIQPIVVGSNEAALGLSDYLLARGVLVPAIRPPTVPKNTARLRISLSAAHTLDDVKLLIQHLHEAEQALLG